MSALKRTLMSVIGDRILERALVAEVNEVSENFRFIDLESESFKSIDLKLGDKIQINTGDWNFRTYTPVVVQHELGRVGILVYLHGNGPGSKWAKQARSGDALHVFGPRRSIQLSGSNAPLVIFGDETGIAVSASIQRRRERPITKMVFEATVPSEVESIVQDMRLEKVDVFKKSPDGNVTEASIQSVLECARNGSHLLLTGRAESIRQMRDRLRSEGIPMSRVTTKAYWATSKQGLD